MVGKVRHSQRMTKAPLPVWITASKEGTILSAHFLGRKAGLAESSSHVESVIFYVEHGQGLMVNLLVPKLSAHGYFLRM